MLRVKQRDMLEHMLQWWKAWEWKCSVELEDRCFLCWPPDRWECANVCKLRDMGGMGAECLQSDKFIMESDHNLLECGEG